MKKLLYLTICAAGILGVTPQLTAQQSEQARVDQATRIAERFLAMPENGIPPRVLRNAKGVAIISVVKGGLLWSGRVGDGVVVARTPQGWSGPSFIHIAGAGFGPQIGANVTDYVIMLNTPEAVRAFSRGVNVQLGGNLSAAAGPVGRTAEFGALPFADVYTYSRSRGLFAGVALEGTTISTNRIANERYYHGPVSAGAILSARVRPPQGAARLRHVF